jgi:hypothetical protein
MLWRGGGHPMLLRGGRVSNRQIPSPIVVRQEIYPILRRGEGRPML